MRRGSCMFLFNSVLVFLLVLSSSPSFLSFIHNDVRGGEAGGVRGVLGEDVSSTTFQSRSYPEVEVDLPTIPSTLWNSASQYEKQSLWGTYRPNLYFGTRAKTPRGVITGMIWSGAGGSELRHWCEQHDGLTRYGWLEHDGINYGSQEIIDGKINLTTSFLKDPLSSKSYEDWSARILGSLTPKKKTPPHHQDAVSLIFYVGVESGGSLSFKKGSKQGVSGDFEITGKTPDLGEFTLSFFIEGNSAPEYGDFEKNYKRQLPDLKRTHFAGLKLGSNLWRNKEEIYQLLRSDAMNRLQSVAFAAREKSRREKTAFPSLALFPALPNIAEPNSDFYAFQFIFLPDFKIDIAYVSHREHPSASSMSIVASSMIGNSLTSVLAARSREFERRFERTFLQSLHLVQSVKNLNALASFARATFSNLIGGLGYFHGNTKVGGPRELELAAQKKLSPQQQQQQQQQWTFSEPKTLLSSVPSRPFFPRGFLWDEGFHQSLIFHWDPRITVEVLTHWLNSMDNRGWIQREMILGDEARAKVPSEFQVQQPDIANPPSFFLVIKKMLTRLRELKSSPQVSPYSSHLSSEEESELLTQFLRSSYPRLRAYFRFFYRTQSGSEPNTFRWRGRTENHTFASGLDDYPRARVPDETEMHLDLLCWMAMSSRVMKEVAVFLQDLSDPSARPPPEDIIDYTLKYSALLESLEKYHWDPITELYSDVELYNKVTKKVIRHSSHIGYVSLFPLLFDLIPLAAASSSSSSSSSSPTTTTTTTTTSSSSSHHHRLLKTMESLRDSKQLWSSFGIRSLSLSSPLFGKDENYWRGPIWINLNYLVLASLHRLKTSSSSSPSSSAGETTTVVELAGSIYQKLRDNILSNTLKVYQETGYVWEQYHPITGKGQRSHPFTGWSALVVAILSEKY